MQKYMFMIIMTVGVAFFYGCGGGGGNSSISLIPTTPPSTPMHTELTAHYSVAQCPTKLDLTEFKDQNPSVLVTEFSDTTCVLIINPNEIAINTKNTNLAIDTNLLYNVDGSKFLYNN